jgi:hypothetical protein
MVRFAVLAVFLVLAHAEAVAAEPRSAAGEALAIREDDIARLEARVEALEARVAKLEAERAGAVVADDEAMERVMVLTERVMRRFFLMVREMKGGGDGEEF